MRARPEPARLQFVLLTLAVMALTACTSTGGLPPTQCPSPPPPANFGVVPPMAGQSSVDIELTRMYVISRVRGMIGTSKPTDSSGADITTIDLQDVTDSAGVITPEVVVNLVPWQRDSNGNPASLQRTYRLVLKLTPHLVTAQSVPDATQRHTLLCPSTPSTCMSDSGAVLSFDFVSLDNVSFSRPACQDPDIIDGMLVPQIYTLLSTQAPLVLPTDAVGSVLASAAGAPLTLTDITVSADNFLKIGMVYNFGSTHTFDRQTMLESHYPSADWVLDIDTSIMTAAVRARLLTTVTASAPGATLTAFSATFTPGEIDVSGKVSVPIPSACGGMTTVSVAARNPMQMCKDASSQSILASWTDSSTSSHNFCVNFNSFWNSIGVGIISGPPPVWPTLAVVNFPVSPTETFYGTQLDTDSAFTIAGRSTVMDSQASPPRSPLPAKCPGVP